VEIRASYLLVGAVVLALLTGLAAFSVWLVKADVDQTMVSYEIAFEGAVTGLQEGSPVRYRGVPVGRVSDIRIDPDNVEQILVDVEIERAAPVKEDTVATLQLQGVTGIAFVQLTGGTQDSPTLRAVSERARPRIASRPSALERLFESTPDLLARGLTVMDRLAAVLDERNAAALSATLANLERFTGSLAGQSEDIEGLVGDASGAARQVEAMSTELNALVGDVRQLTSQFEQDFDGVGGEVTATMDELRTTANALGGAAGELEGALADMRQPLGDFAESGLYEFSQLVGETRLLVAALTRITKEFERDPTGFLLGSNQGFEAE